MLFSSPIFFAFFLLYFTAHSLVPPRYRVALIIVGSTIFYAWWKVSYVWLPYLLMAIAYAGVWCVERVRGARRRKAAVTVAIAALFLPLIFFKYTNFIYRDVLGPFFDWHGALLALPLPLGISFVTFTLAAYLVDVYQGGFPPVRNAGTLLGYVLFFPHLIAGPILRPHELIPQLERPRQATLRRLAGPVAIVTLGLVKKLVFADQIAAVVDPVYGAAGVASAPAAVLAIYGFAAQIYCDFSGYTDMAIGLALLLGIRLPINFQRPYAADTIVEFWRRWHITLSFWLRDYLYIPLGGNRNGRIEETRNILVTMALGGLWHGANWTFLVWGLLHGAAVAVIHGMRHALSRSRVALPSWLAVATTFHFVTIGWVLFRAPDFPVAMRVLAAPFGDWHGATEFATRNMFVLSLLAVFFLLHRFDDHRRILAMTRYVRGEILWPALAFFWLLALTISHGTSANFIYFEF